MTYNLSDEELVRRFRAGEDVTALAGRFGCSTETIRRRLRPLVGPLPQGGWRGGVRSKAAPAPAPEAMPAPRLPRLRLVVAEAEASVPVPPAPLDPLDAAVLRGGNTWAGRAAIAKEFAVPMGVVESRFHRLRASGASAPRQAGSSRDSGTAAGNFDWTRARIAKAQDLRRDCYGTCDIAAYFGVSQGAVLAMFKREADKAQSAGREAAE